MITEKKTEIAYFVHKLNEKDIVYIKWCSNKHTIFYCYLQVYCKDERCIII